MKLRWPFALRSSVDHYRILFNNERARNDELGHTLTDALNETYRLRVALGNRSAAFKRAVEVITKVQ